MPRPTSIKKDVCCTVSTPTPIVDYVFIGDTVECTCSAYKFYKNYCNKFKSGEWRLTVLFEGQDLVSCQQNIYNVDFPVTNLLFYKSFFRSQAVAYIAKGDQINSNVQNQYENLAQFDKIPRGPLGDFVTLTTIPEISLTYINLWTHKNAINFIQQNCIAVDFNTVEKQVLANLSSKSALGKTGVCEEIVGPSVPKKHLFFAKAPCNGTQIKQRNLLEKYYFRLLEAAMTYKNTVRLFYNVTNMTFNKSTVGCGWDLTFTTPGLKNTNPATISISNASIKFRTDPLTYTKIVTEGLQGCGTADSRVPVIVNIPVQYRSIISAPISIIQDSQGNTMPIRNDLVTTSFTFAVGDTSMNQSTTYGFTAYPTFSGYVYTIAEDLRTGLYPADGYVLLVTEGVFGARMARKCYYDIRIKANIILFATNRVEKYTRQNMTNIQTAIYESYGLTTAQVPPVTSVVELLNSTYGLKKDYQWFSFTPRYYTMPAIMLRLINYLYEQETTNFTATSNMPCCNDTSATG